MIKVLIHYTSNWAELTNISKPILEEYCNKHGYEFHCKEVDTYPIYNGLEKLKMIGEFLNEGDIGLVMDADSLVTNMNIMVESFLEDGKDFYLSEGMNMGVFIIRKTEVTQRIVSLIIAEIECRIYHCEQDAMENHSKHFDNICVKKHPCFNSYMSELYPEIPQPVSEKQGQWIQGKSFILHLPALGMEKRLEIMKNIKITK